MNGQQPRQRLPVAYHAASTPASRRLPKSLPELIPAAEQYQKLVDMERKLDATITRKRYDMQDALYRPLKTRRTLRLWCSNTAIDQAWQVLASGIDENNFDFETGNVPSWTLRLEGQLLPIVADEDMTKLPKFTDLVRTVTVEEDRGFDGLYGESPLLEYQKPPVKAGEVGLSLPGLEMNRKGDSDVRLKISLTLENSPERYKLQTKLAELLGIAEATRQEVITNLWSYVQAEKLQDAEEKRLIHADPPLREIFSLERIFFPDLPKLITKLLLPCDPITLDYTVHVDKERSQADHPWDVEVFIDSPIRNVYIEALEKLQNPNPEILTIDQKISALIQEIDQHLAKKEFFDSYVADPAIFIRRWLASQNEDMEVMMGDVKKVSGEHARRADFYSADKDWLRENMFHYLAQERTV